MLQLNLSDVVSLTHDIVFRRRSIANDEKMIDEMIESRRGDEDEDEDIDETKMTSIILDLLKLNCRNKIAEESFPTALNKVYVFKK